jgi:TolB-like protein/DNA-binding SARP family transcriptional activator
MASLVKELKRRNVFRVAVGYLILGWVVLQITDIVAPALHLPEWTMTLVLLLGVIGFPFALFFAWAFELTPEGLKREHEVDRSQSITHHTGRKVDFAIIGLLVVALVFIAWDAYLSGPDDEVPVAEAVGTAVETAQIEPGQATPVSIAVLPFVNMSPDPDQEYFSDGLSEEILNLLAKVPDLKVIARTSSFAFKGKNQDIRTIGKALDVSTVLEGSVRKSGERVRITAQLIEVSSGAHIWSDTFDRTLTDIFAVQDDVASEILKALQVHVGEAPKRGRPTESSEAYTFFLSARAALNRYEDADARRSAQKAVELDPLFAEAYELLALAYWASNGASLDATKAQRGVNDAAAKALAIDPSLFFAQALLVESDSRFSWTSSLETLDRVLREQPNNVGLMSVLSWDLQVAGYFQEALSITEHWVELDPLSTQAHVNLYWARLSVDKRGEALESLKTAHQLGLSWAPHNLASFYLVEKQDGAAIEYLEAGFQIDGLPTEFAQELIVDARNPETGQAFLDQFLPQIVASRPNDRSAREQRILLAPFYSVFGFLDRYFELLFEFGISTDDWDDAEVPVHDSTIDRRSGFTAHPRYLEIAKTWGLTELWDQRGPPDMCEKLDGQWVCE